MSDAVRRLAGAAAPSISGRGPSSSGDQRLSHFRAEEVAPQLLEEVFVTGGIIKLSDFNSATLAYANRLALISVLIDTAPASILRWGHTGLLFECGIEHGFRIESGFTHHL